MNQFKAYQSAGQKIQSFIMGLRKEYENKKDFYFWIIFALGFCYIGWVIKLLNFYITF